MKDWFRSLLLKWGLIRVEYITVVKPIKRAKVKHSPEEVTGHCYIEDGELGMVPSGVAETPPHGDLVWNYHCVHQDKKGYCTYYSECCFKQQLSVREELAFFPPEKAPLQV